MKSLINKRILFFFIVIISSCIYLPYLNLQQKVDIESESILFDINQGDSLGKILNNLNNSRNFTEILQNLAKFPRNLKKIIIIITIFLNMFVKFRQKIHQNLEKNRVLNEKLRIFE